MRVKSVGNAVIGLFLGFLTAFATPALSAGGADNNGATGAMQNFTWAESPVDVPDIAFKDAAGKELHLSDFKGQVVLLNFWATWCGPCRREMPDLDALQDKLGSKDFLVLALSQDRKGVSAVQDFYKEIGIKHLSLYIDQKARTARKLRVPGLPTTILLNRKGQEIGRLVGPADWFSEEAQQIIIKTIAAK